MIEDSKSVFITHPYYAVNNPTNNLRIYKKAKNSNKWTYIQCKTKEEYRNRLKEYVGGFSSGGMLGRTVVWLRFPRYQCYGGIFSACWLFAFFGETSIQVLTPFLS